MTKSNILRLVPLFLCVLICGFNSSASGLTVAKTDFSGKWAVDRSKLNPQSPISDQNLQIAQTDIQMSVENNLVLSFGKTTINDVYMLSGKEEDFIWKRPNGLEGVGKRKSVWSADGKILQVEQEAYFDSAGGPVTYQLSQKWSLSDGGTILTIEGILKILPFTTLPSKSVFVKVK